MTRQFVELNSFRNSWTALGLDDNTLDTLERQLLANPSAGAVMPGCGGARKIRIALPGRGKSSGGRVITSISFYMNGYIYCFHIQKTSKRILLKNKNNMCAI